MSTSIIISLVLSDKSLTGAKRLVMLSMCDSMASVSVQTAAHWTNLGVDETSRIINEMVDEGWFVEVDGKLIQPQIWKAIHEDHRPRPRTQSERRRDQFKLSSAHRALIYQRDNFRCHYCGSNDRLTIDHKTPMSRGGSDDIENLVTCCKTCNSSKGAKTYAEFLALRSSNA